MAKSLFKQEYYDASKLKKSLDLTFSGLSPIIDFSSERFKEEFPRYF